MADSRFDELVGHVKEGLDESAPINLAFYGGDHWQGSEGWVGPRPEINSADSLTYTKVMREIANAFTSQNAIKEVVDRHTDALLGREPLWRLVLKRPLKMITDENGNQVPEEPTEEEQQLIKEAEHALTVWWDTKGLLSTLQEALRTALQTNRATLRIFIPKSELEVVDGLPIVPEGSLEETLERIYVQLPDYDSANVWVNPRTMQPTSLYHYTEDDHEFLEISYVQKDPETKTKQTVLQILRRTDSSTAEDPQPTNPAITLNLDGHLWMVALELPLLVTEQVRQNQKQLNKTLTMTGRNMDAAGFLERIILNAQLPGHFEEDENGVQKWVDDEYQTGPMTTNFLQGTAYTDENGTVRLAQPSAIFREPIGPETFEEGQNLFYRAILKEVRQMHALISGDAITSGESRRQAMADFVTSLATTKSRIDKTIRNLLEVVLRLGAIFSGDEERYSGLRIESNTQIRPGPISTEEMRFIIEQVLAHLMSRETAMVELGRDDPGAEEEKIQADILMEMQREMDKMRQSQELMAEFAPPEQSGSTQRVDAQKKGTAKPVSGSQNRAAAARTSKVK